MNQILLTEKENFNNKKGNKNMHKIILVFSILVLIFAIISILVYVFKIYKNNNKKNKPLETPKLSIEETEENKNIKVIAESENGISKIIYIWNNDEPKEVELNGRINHEEKIEIPTGQNTLKVKVIDVNNQEIEMTKEFDIKLDTKPIINTEIEDDAKLKIKASDIGAMKYITYKWDEEEEVKIEAENENDSIIETKIDIKRGSHKITIKAVNTKNQEEICEKKFKGVNKPIIEVERDGKVLYMKMTHDMGFEKIEFLINGKLHKYDKDYEGYDETKTEVEFKFNLKEGENKIVILAISTEGTEGIYKGKCTYNVQQ